MIEVEVKALVQNVNIIRDYLLQRDFKYIKNEKQLNHYFSYNDYSLAYLFNTLKQHLNTDEELELSSVLDKGSNYSIRTRCINNKDTYFIIKYSLFDKDSSNGSIRKEYEIKLDLTVEDLDKLLLDNGLNYSSKWSRERDIYTKDNYTATIDLNAGYGYLLELETLTNDLDSANSYKEILLNELSKLRLKELNNKLLNIMFSYYENNWSKYYSTNNYIWNDIEFYKYLVDQLF